MKNTELPIEKLKEEENVMRKRTDNYLLILSSNEPSPFITQN